MIMFSHLAIPLKVSRAQGIHWFDLSGTCWLDHSGTLADRCIVAGIRIMDGSSCGWSDCSRDILMQHNWVLRDAVSAAP